MMQHAVDVTDLMEAFLDDLKEEAVLLERKLRGDEAPVKKELRVQKESNLPGFELLQSLEDSVQALDEAGAKQRLADCKDRICKLQENEAYRKTLRARLVKDVGGKLHRPGRLTQLTLQQEEQAAWRHGWSSMQPWRSQPLEIKSSWLSLWRTPCSSSSTEQIAS